MSAAIQRILFASLVVVLWPEDAHAYLDPGSGSMLLQLLVAGVAGLIVFSRIFWRRILVALGLRKKPTATALPPAAEAPGTDSGKLAG